MPPVRTRSRHLYVAAWPDERSRPASQLGRCAAGVTPRGACARTPRRLEGTGGGSPSRRRCGRPALARAGALLLVPWPVRRVTRAVPARHEQFTVAGERRLPRAEAEGRQPGLRPDGLEEVVVDQLADLGWSRTESNRGHRDFRSRARCGGPSLPRQRRLFPPRSQLLGGYVRTRRSRKDWCLQEKSVRSIGLLIHRCGVRFPEGPPLAPPKVSTA